jgi:hypothetical protein
VCSAGARALWIDMLCLMHEGEPYGHLTILGRPMTTDVLAKLVGESAAAVKRWVNELRDNAVFSETDDGLIFSRRMVRDERVREVRAAGGQAGAEHGSKGGSHGSKGGRPRKQEGASGDETRGDKKPPLKPPPSSSSSSPASQGSEDKSSGDFAAVEDLDGTAWQTARTVLVDQGGLSRDDAGKFFGKLLSIHKLEPRDMLSCVAQAVVIRTEDPRGFLTKGAQAISRRRAGSNVQPLRQGFV